MQETLQDHTDTCRQKICRSGGHAPFRCHCLCDCKETLQDRLTREAREKIENFCFEDIFNDEGAKEFDTIINQIISHTIAETIKAGVSVIEGEKRNQDAPKEGDPHFTGCGGCGEEYPTICGCREVNQALQTAVTKLQELGK